MSQITEKHIEAIEKNWSIFLDLVSRISNEDIKKALTTLCEEVQDRLSVCPASTQYAGSYAGGLVEMNLNVLKIAKELNKIYRADISVDKLITVCLFHSIGKLGNKEEDFYLEQQSSWHRERGMMFEINKNLPNTPYPIRTIWWLNSYGVSLDEEELFAISSMQDIGRSEYRSNELYDCPLLSVILQQSTRVAFIKNKEKKSVLG
jgi:hypothetical protein